MHLKIQSATTLSKTDQNRLERLAQKAGRTPQAMLRFVLRHGFAVCDEDVAESIAADKEFLAGKFVDQRDVMKAARKQLKRASKNA